MASCPSTTELFGDISYLVISDIHFFHPSTPTSHIATNVVNFFDDFKPTSRFAKLDIIFVAGDIFENILYYRHPDVLTVQALFRRLMSFCKTHGIRLRILEGTKSHDHKQAANFQSIADAFGADLDYKYIQSLHIEKFSDLNLSVLYVPDEWKDSAKICAEETDALLEEHGLEQVDIAIMHGMFEYQIPEISEHPLMHSSVFYLERVKYFINIGHIHTASVFLRILAQGSFDRLAHSQEEKKGAMVVTLRRSGHHSWEFIENPGALTYKTVTLEHEDMDRSVIQVRKAIDKLPDDSHVRIIAAKDHPLFAGFNQLKRAYPTFHFKKQDVKQKDKSQVDKLTGIISLDHSYVPFTIDQGNIVGQVMDEVENESPLTVEQRMLLLQELEAINV